MGWMMQALQGVGGAAQGMGGAAANMAKGMGSGMIGNVGQTMPAGVAGPALPSSGLMGTLSSGGIPAGTFSNLGSMQGFGNALGSLAATQLLPGGMRQGMGGMLGGGGGTYGTPTQGMDQQQLLSMILQSILQR